MPLDGNRHVAARRPSRFQWRLRSLLGVLTVIALALAGWRAWVAPLHEEAMVIARLRRLGAGVRTVAAGPAWLQQAPGFRYRHATLVHLDVCSKPILDGDLTSLSKLPRLRELRFKDRITPAALERLQEFPELVAVSLADTNITDADLHFLRDMPQLKSVALGNQVTIRGLEGLADARPDLNCGYAESLYKLGFDAARGLEPEVVVYDFEVAARWKYTCAGFKPDPRQSELAALQQLAGNYEQLLRQVAGPPRFRSVVSCALASTRMRHLMLSGNEDAARRESLHAVAAANQARDLSWRAYEANVELVRGLLHALELCKNTQSAAAEIQGDAVAKLSALQSYVRDLHRLQQQVAALYAISQRGGEADHYCSVELACAFADAELAALQGDDQERHLILECARDAAAELPQSLLDYGGIVDGLDFFQSHELIKRFEEESALPRHDMTEARRARERWSNFVADWCGRLQRVPQLDPRKPQATLISMCLYATDRIDREGRPFFERTLGQIRDDLNAKRPDVDEVDMVPVPTATPAECQE